MNKLFLLREGFIVQSAVEFTDCISAEAWDSSNECPGYMTLYNLMVRFQ